MYAIIETGGKQYRVRPGDTIDVERLEGTPGGTVDVGRVLMIGGDGAETRIGTPTLENAVVRAEVVEQTRGEKIIVFRFKAKVRYRRKTGHRQHLTRLRITDILLDGDRVGGAEARASEPVAASQQTTAIVEAPEAALPAPAPQEA